MKKSLTYSDKLKDPRWQKKRLQVLERDNWSCQICGDTESTLHIHHKLYLNEQGEKCEPWEVVDKYLVTLCEDCHNSESEFVNESTAILVQAAKEQFLSADIHNIAIGIHFMPMVHSPEIVAVAIEHWFKREELMKLLVNTYLDSLSKRRKQSNP